MKYLIVIFLIVISFLMGAFVGDRAGVDSRAYYDASGKLKILSSALDQQKENEWINGEIIKQVRILNESDITPFKSGFFLKITGNESFISEHEKYLPIIKASQIYKEKISFLCKYNEKYQSECN